MTVVGSVEYDVLGVIDPGKFDKSIDTPLNRAAARAGDRFGTLLGKGIAAAVRPFAARAGDEAGSEFAKNARSHGVSLGKTLGVGLAAGFGFSAANLSFDSLFRGLQSTVDAADELEKAGTGAEATFGAATSEVEAFAKSRQNLLLTQTQALQSASVYGDILRGVGVAAEPAAKTSTALVGVAENLAAIKGLNVETVLTGLRGGLQGTSRNVRALGLDLSVGRVTAEAYALGLAKPVKDVGAIQAAQNKVAASTDNLAKVQKEHGTGTLAAAKAQDQLTAAQAGLVKAQSGSHQALSQEVLLQARAALILRETQAATGGAARNQDTYAVATQRLHKQIGDMATTIGTAALPKISELTSHAAKLVDEFIAGKGAGGQIRTTLQGLGQDAKEAGDLLESTVMPVIKFFAAHPGAFKVAAEGMAAYATASKFAALYNARLAVSVPAVAAGEAAVAAESAGAAAGVGAVGGAATLALPEVAALGAALLGVYQVWKQVKGLKDDQKFYKNLPNTYPNLGTLAQREYDRDPAAYIATHKDFQPPGSAADPLVTAKNDNADRSGRRAAASAQAAGKAAADAAKKTQDQAKATKYAADQLAAYQARQAAAVQAAEDAARARGEATTKLLQAQSDQIKKQVDVLTAYGAKISDFRRGIFAGTTQFTALTGLVSDPSRATASAIVGSLQSRVIAEKLFAKNLATLGQRGLDKGVLGELALAGPDQRAFASALAQGSPEQIRALNAAERASRAQAQSLAAQATDTAFGAGAVAKNQRALAEQNRRLAHIETLLAAQPALIGKAVDQAGKNVKAAQKTGTRTAVAR